jgi:hypothetical protein
LRLVAFVMSTAAGDQLRCSVSECWPFGPGSTDRYPATHLGVPDFRLSLGRATNDEVIGADRR